MKNVNMIGLGYIGLPTAAVMAREGLAVTGVDVDIAVCQTINQGDIHIVEPGLETLVRDSVTMGRLRAQTTPTAADIFVIAVPTPFKDDYQPDVRYVHSACENLAGVLKVGDLVILESTSPVGTTEDMATLLQSLRPDLRIAKEGQENPDVFVAYCPERVLPGNVIEELISNDRAIGGVTPACAQQAKAFYETFVKGECIATQARTAEMAKLVENSFRDVNIAFANELSMICENLNINVWELIALANRHPRVNILTPGAGVGGHCIAVDPWFIVSRSPEQARLIRTAREVNDSKPDWVAQRVSDRLFGFSGKTVRVACYGLSFKPNIDDLRESPAIGIVNTLMANHPEVVFELVEPHISSIDEVGTLQGENAKLVDVDAAKTADIKLVLVGHDAFKSLPEITGSDTINVAWAN